MEKLTLNKTKTISNFSLYYNRIILTCNITRAVGGAEHAYISEAHDATLILCWSSYCKCFIFFVFRLVFLPFICRVFFVVFVLNSPSIKILMTIQFKITLFQWRQKVIQRQINGHSEQNDKCEFVYCPINVDTSVFFVNIWIKVTYNNSFLSLFD